MPLAFENLVPYLVFWPLKSWRNDSTISLSLAHLVRLTLESLPSLDLLSSILNFLLPFRNQLPKVS